MSAAREEPSAPRSAGGWTTRRPWSTISYYRRRAWRWGRVLGEYRPGTVDARPGPRRVLVVRLDAIGDFVLWSGAAREMRRWLGPDTHVTLAANVVWADLAEAAGIADEVWPVRRHSLEWDAQYRADLLAQVERGQFTLAINPCYTREMMLGDSMVRWTRAAERIGSVGEGLLLSPEDRRFADRWYTRFLPASGEWMHESDRNAEFLRALGVPLARVPGPSLDGVGLVLPERFGELHEDYFIVFPGAGHSGRQWASRDFAAVARHVTERTAWRAVVLGHADDMLTARAVASEVPGAIDLSGKTSVAELAAVIRHSRLVLTNETSAVHLAAATGVRAICIAGCGHWRRFVPYPASLGVLADLVEVVSIDEDMKCLDCNWRCVLPHVAGEALPCVSRVPVERVIGAVDRVLSRVMVATENG